MSFSVVVTPADMPEIEAIDKIFDVAGVNPGNEYNEFTEPLGKPRGLMQGFSLAPGLPGGNAA